MGLKLVGAGLGRTGTLSIKLALEQLGFGPCYHMTELFIHPTHAPLWERAADGHPDWRTLFSGYASTVDYPGCTFWRDLARSYPEAKVLLTVRDARSWFDSTQETIFSEQSTQTLQGSPLEEFFNKTVWRGLRDRIHDREFMIDHFARHNAEVEHTIPPARLLVYETKQGWDPLCAFLGVPVPGQPFPHVNSREDYVRRHSEHLAQGHEPFGSEEMGDRMRERLDQLRGES
ncbi:MAG: sulfotransferase family protein [Steroidobacteraceae bacterium]